MTNETKVRGFLKTKTLLKLNTKIGMRIKELKIHTKPNFVASNMNLLEALTCMKDKESGVLIITNESVK